jgi:hypothetical protein
MSSFLLGGRAWTVERVNHEDRHVHVREAPAGVKPSWGGFVPQFLGFELCQRMKKVLTDAGRYPYVDEPGSVHLEEKRADLGPVLRRPGYAVQLDGNVALWWTFAGGRINHTLKYGLEVSEGWKVVADNFQLRIDGNGVTHESVRRAIGKMASAAFWDAPEMRKAILAKLPGYRLSKFQDALPERFALEMIENYLLDVAGTVRWLADAAGTSNRRPRVQLRDITADTPEHLRAGLEGRWLDLPERLGLHDLNIVAHMLQGYEIASEHLGRDALDVDADLRRRFDATGEWQGSTIELLVVFFMHVRAWRGLWEGPFAGDENHRTAQVLYEAVRRRLREHPEEVEFVAATPYQEP